MTLDTPITRILGRSPAIRRALHEAQRAASMSGPVLILGERGTGKELFARFVHRHSRRRRSPLVCVNCASLSPELADSLLFGHERGAFTGAVRASGGHVGAAEGGTLLLDEIGELPLAVQARLLRLLQEGKVVSVGDTAERPVNVRVLAATNRDLAAMAREGRFREDLLDRLRVWELKLPPLRDRKADLRELAEGVLEREPDLAGRRLSLGRGAVAALRSHDWPGNVRELQRVLLRVGAGMADGEVIQARQVRAVLAAEGAPAPAAGPCADQRLLDVFRGDELVSMAALEIRTGLPRSTLKAAATRLIAAGRLGRAGENRSTRYWRAAGGDAVGPPTETLHPLARAAVAVLAHGEALSCHAVSQRLEVSVSTALRALTSLVQAGLVTRTGRARSTTYSLPGARPVAMTETQAAELLQPAVPPPAPPPPPAQPRDRPEIDRLALSLAQSRGAVARRELVQASGYSARSALRSLRRLEAAGELVQAGGRGCTTRYGVPGRTPPAPQPRSSGPSTPRSRPARSPGPGQTDALFLAVALVAALQRGPRRPEILERHAGMPLERARAALKEIAARGLLVEVADGYALAPPDRLLGDS